jgi:hypothetical protein
VDLYIQKRQPKYIAVNKSLPDLNCTYA